MVDQTFKSTKKGGYCVVGNDIAQAFRRNLEALGLYIFLLSLPDQWEFKKSWLMKETGLGIHKLNRLLAVLSKHNLVKTKQRKISGKFAEFEMEIFDGKDFKNKDLTPLFGSPCDRNRITETVITEIAHKKVKSKKVKTKKESSACVKKKKSFCPGIIDLVLSDEAKAIAVEKGLDIDLVFNKFSDYSKAQGLAYVDWKAAFVKWVRGERVNRNYVENKNNASAAINSKPCVNDVAIRGDNNLVIKTKMPDSLRAICENLKRN